MNELPQTGGGAIYEISDTGFVEKVLRKVPDREAAGSTSAQAAVGATYYDDEGRFYIDGYLR